MTLTIDKYSQNNNIIYLQYINKTLSLQYTDVAYYFEQDNEPEDATNTNIQYIWRSLAKNQWFTGNKNGWKPLTAVKVGEFVGNFTVFINSLTVENPIRINADMNFANPDLSNLTIDGEKHFINKNQVTNCILEAPNGVATYGTNTVTIKKGVKILIPNGRNADGTLNNIEYTFPEDKTYPAFVLDKLRRGITLGYVNGEMVIPPNFTAYATDPAWQNVYMQNNKPDISLFRGAVWYYPDENKTYYFLKEKMSDFTQLPLFFFGYEVSNGTKLTHF